MTHTHKKNGGDRTNEQGNVLFLILIAVALFAALSYAVTQSTRGGGNADDETSLISSAALTQYPASLKTSILRLSISSGVTGTALEFNQPSEFGTCTSSGANCVFHSSGGGASYQDAPSDVVTGASPQEWLFNAENDIFNIGVNATVGDTPDTSSFEVIAFLANVTNGVCTKINEELGIGATIPAETGIDVTVRMINGVGAISAANGGTIGNDVAALDGQPFGCFSQGGANYYYHTLDEN